MPKIRRCLAMFCLVLPGLGTATAAEPYVGYDGFGSPQLSPDLWLNLERVRAAQQKGLRLSQRDLGDQYGNEGTRRSTNGVDMIDPSQVTQMRATLRVTALEVAGCAEGAPNPEPADAQARLIGSFFASEAGSDQTHDVIALARITRRSNSGDPVGVLRVEGVVLECGNAACTQYPFIEVADLGTTALDTAVNLWLVWDATNNRFRFSRDGAPFVNVGYDIPDALPPNVPFKSLQSRTILPNCLTGARASGLVDARFDNFQVNAEAAP